MLKTIGAPHCIGTVHTPMPKEFTVQALDASNDPVKAKLVTFTSDPPDALEFPGGHSYACVETDAHGKASVRVTPREDGACHKLIAEASGALGRTHFTIEANAGDEPTVRHAGGVTIVDARGRSVPATPAPSREVNWPIAACVIAAIVMLAGLWAITALGRSGEHVATSGVHAPTPPAPTTLVDAAARTKADEALAATQRLDDLREQTDRQVDLRAYRTEVDARVRSMGNAVYDAARRADDGVELRQKLLAFRDSCLHCDPAEERRR